jgi:hypothetical protein
MTNRMYCLLFLSLAACPALSQTEHEERPQNTFQKIFTISKSSLPSGIIQTRDDGFMMSGYQAGDAFGNRDGLLLRLDKRGRPVWAKGYDHPEADYYLYGNTELYDGSVVAVADHFDGKGAILRENRQGTIAWQKAYSIAGSAVNFSLIQRLPDGKFMAAGTVMDENYNMSSLLVKFNLNGGITWQKVYELPGRRNTPVAITAIGDTVFVAGIIPSAIFNTADTAFILKVNSRNGMSYASKKIWLEGNSIFNLLLTKKTDNNLVLTATMGSVTTGQTTRSLSLLNSRLEIAKTVTVNDVPDGQLMAATPAADKGIVLVLNDASNETGYLLKFNRLLQPIFARYYPQQYRGSVAYHFTDVFATSDGGYIAAGGRVLTDSSVSYVVKTDRNGNTGLCNSASITPSVVEISLATAGFAWPVVYNPAITSENMMVPQNELAKLVTDLCRSNCNEDRYANNTPQPAILEEGDNAFAVQVYPNPSNSYFTIRITGSDPLPVMVLIRDMNGRLCNKLNMKVNQPVNIGSELRPGVYMAEIVQGGERKIFRLMKL